VAYFFLTHNPITPILPLSKSEFLSLRLLYNSCLLDRKTHYQQNGKGLSRVPQQEVLRRDKEKTRFLREVHSQVLQDVLFRLERAYNNFFRRVKLKKEEKWKKK